MGALRRLIQKNVRWRGDHRLSTLVAGLYSFFTAFVLGLRQMLVGLVIIDVLKWYDQKTSIFIIDLLLGRGRYSIRSKFYTLPFFMYLLLLDPRGMVWLILRW